MLRGWGWHYGWVEGVSIGGDDFVNFVKSGLAEAGVLWD